MQRHCVGLRCLLFDRDLHSRLRARTPRCPNASDQRRALESHPYLLTLATWPIPSDPYLLTLANPAQLEGKFGHVKMTSEHFNTAGRDVKTGLTASVSLDHSLNPNPVPTLPLPLLRLNPS